jgi:hypothetical protein
MESIQITGNKARFDNYLTDPMKIPKNGKVCLNKASFSIPCWTQRYLEVPSIATPTDIMLYLELNGVQTSITWAEFHTAWDTLNLIEQRSQAEFYNGTYKFFFNNLNLFFDQNALDTATVPTLTEVLSKAFDDKFSFYQFTSQDVIVNAIDTDVSKTDLLVINGVEYEPRPTNLKIDSLKIVAKYAPDKMFNSTPVNIGDGAIDNFLEINDVTVVNNNGFGAKITFTHVGTPKIYGGIAVNESIKIDPNGGYWSFKPNLTGTSGSMICSFLMTNDLNFSTNTTFVDPNNFPFGIIFEQDGDGQYFRLLDNIVNDGTNSRVVQYPTEDSKIFELQNDSDRFFISCWKAPDFAENRKNYVFSVYVAHASDDPSDSELLWTSEYLLPNPGISLYPIAIADDSNLELKQNRYIPKSLDSANMEDLVNYGSDASFTITPNNFQNFDLSTFKFFNDLGLYQNDSNFATGLFNRELTSYNNGGASNSISWTTGKLPKKYFVGVKNYTDIFDVSDGFLNLKSGQVELPRQIEISLLNLGHTPHTGSFAQEVLFTEPDINKVISYINTDPIYFNSENNMYIEYVYEAFNLVCRRLKNRSKIPLANFQIKLGYKNFITNLEENIDQVRGTVKLEILFEQDHADDSE